MKNKTWLYWTIAIIITLGAAFYQKITGPTYPIKYKFSLNGLEEKIVLPTSHGGETDCPLQIHLNTPIDSAFLYFKRFPSVDQWTRIELVHINDSMIAFLPQQPPAGKLAYYIELFSGGRLIPVKNEKPVIIRFKGDVPAYILIPHILFIFMAMLISNLAGLLAAGKKKTFRFYGKMAFFLMLFGGMILGPVVQKFAFGEFWAGVPFGWDLTDNKTLIAFIFWIFAFAANYRKERRYAIIIAAIVTLIIFSIPHSMFGSEFNYETGTIGQG